MNLTKFKRITLRKLLNYSSEKVKRYYKETHKQFHYNFQSMFNVIGIETIAVCNRACDFCPVSLDNWKTDARTNKIMDEELFFKIIDELSQIKFIGSIRPYFFNEPLLDKRLEKFIRYAREKCPQANILIKSNGDLLTYEKYKVLKDAGVNNWRITQYDGVFSKNIIDIFLKLDLEERKNFEVRILDEFYENRAREDKKIVDKNILNSPCDFPQEALYITSDGIVALCPSDGFGKVVLGDTNMQNVVDIWQSEKFKKVRGYLERGDRTKIPLCTTCNHYPGINSTVNKVKLL